MIKSSRSQKGFTLIEVMIVVIILGVLAAIAVPAYDSMKRRGFRSDAISALTDAAQLQERLYSNAGVYGGTLAAIGVSGATSENGHYQLDIPSVTDETFIITATAVGLQLNDENCRTFSIDQAGRKTSTDDTATASSGCWPK